MKWPFRKRKENKQVDKFAETSSKSVYVRVDNLDSSVLEDKFMFSTTSSKIKSYEQIVWIYAAVQAIARAARTVQLDVYNERGKLVTNPNDPVYRLINYPNDDMGTGDLLEAFCIDLCLAGNFFLEFPGAALYVVQPHRMTPVVENGRLVRWEYETNGNEKIAVPPDRIIHIKLFHPADDFMGLSPLSAAVYAGRILNYSDKHIIKFYEKGGTLGGVLETDQFLPDHIYNRIVKRWKEAYNGIDRAFEVPILEGGLKYREVQLPLRDAVILDTKKFSREEILAIYQVPPGVLGIRESGNRATLEFERRIFWEDTILPLLDRFVEAFNTQIIPRITDKKYIVKINTEKIEALRENRIAKAKYIRMLVDGAIMTINEARERFGLPPHPQGDILLIPLNMLPVDGGRKPENNEGRPKPDKIQHEFDYKNLSLYDFTVLHSMASVYLMTRLTEIFDMQKQYVERELSEYMMDHPLATQEELEKFVAEVLDEYRNEKKKETTNLMTKILFAVYLSVYKTFGAEVPIDIDVPPELVAASKQWSEEILGYIDQTTVKNLIKEVMYRIEMGSSVQQAINDVYHKLLDTVIGERIERIAATESTFIVNKALLEAAKKAGKKFKIWKTMRDEKVRISHQEAEGQKVPIDKPFIVGGEKADHPGDIKGLSPQNRLNCRCWMVFTDE